MKKIITFIFLITATLSSNPIQKYSSIGNLELTNGDTLFDCIVGYRTFGTLNKQKSNVILFCTWYMGSSEDLQSYVGKNQFVDSIEYFVIAVDALGDGISSSPSNSKKQLGEQFPQISIRDMVNSQYKMLKKEFGLAQLHGILGGSMGGMQVFEWIVMYPDFMKKAVAYVGTPQLSSYNRLLFSLQTKIIEMGKKYKMSEADQSRLYSMAFALTLRTPEFINKNVQFNNFQKYLLEFEADTISNSRFENLLRQLSAMVHHDISAQWNGNMKEAAKKVKAKLLLLVADNDLTVSPQPAIEFASLTNAKLIRFNNDCGHLAPGCEMEKTSTSIQEFFGN